MQSLIMFCMSLIIIHIKCIMRPNHVFRHFCRIAIYCCLKEIFSVVVIIQNPKILILDEATAAMDTETERNIQESLGSLKEGRTTLAIAHRLSTLRDADMLCVIDDGKVVEYGTYAELMRKKGEYYKLYKIQSEALKYVGVGGD